MKKFLWLCPILITFVSAVARDAPEIPQPVVEKLRMSAAFSMVGGSSFGTHSTENAEKSAAIEANGNVVYGSFSDQFGGTTRVPANTVLFLHTHPHNGNPKPSPVDIETARKLGVPNCAVSLEEIWCAMPDGKVVKAY
jgi:proteasome lid subunit RPN8/RPN11